MRGATFEDSLHAIPPNGVCSFPALDSTESPEGPRSCLAWASYLPRSESLWARVEDHSLELCTAHAVSPPSVAHRRDGDWEIAACVGGAREWTLRRFALAADGSKARELAALPVSAAPLRGVRLCAGTEHTWLAASHHADGGNSVVLYRCTDATCTREFTSPPELDALRPSLCVLKGGPILVYDAWDGTGYAVYAQSNAGHLGVSGPGSIKDGWSLLADVAAESADTLLLCWIRTRDIISSGGVVDAECTVQIARLTLSGAGPERTESWDDFESLSHGLLDTDPDPQGVWGYLGRRRRPMVARCGERMHLLWEQKEIHHGATRSNRGVLWSREVGSPTSTSAEAWSTGALWYALPSSRSSDRSGTLAIACLEGMFTDERRVALRMASPTDAPARLDIGHWQGWQPTDLAPRLASPRERPAAKIGSREYRLYWFDLHCHTVLSADAEGEPDECVRTGRYKAGLDGMLATDNDHYVVPMSRWEWREACDTASDSSLPGEFLALHGYEWTSRPVVAGEQIVDHRSVLLPGAAEDIVRWNEVEGDIQALYEYVRQREGIVHAHHQDWHLLGHEVEANIEACSSWRAYLELDSGPYHRALATGAKLGVIGGSDEHRRNPGLGGALTGIWAEDLTPQAILDALRAHRCYATSGRRVLLDFRINGQPMGSTLRAVNCAVSVVLRSPVAIREAQVWSDGSVVHTWEVRDTEADLALERTCSPGSHYFYVKLILEGDEIEELPSNLQPLYGTRAWSSPIWVEGGTT